MGKTYWCHKEFTPGLTCVNNINGVCYSDSFSNLLSPCVSRRPYPPQPKPKNVKLRKQVNESSPKKVVVRVASKSYDPVAKAYKVLVDAFFGGNIDLCAAVEEAIGYLGEALAD